MSTTAAYAQDRESALRRELDAWGEEQKREAGMAPPPAPEVPAPVTPEDKRRAQPTGFLDPHAAPGRYVAGAAVGATLGTAKEGVQNFVSGVWQGLTGRLGKTSIQEGNTAQVQAAGQALLGGMQIVMALPAGIGTAVEQAMLNYTPDKAKMVVPGLEGGEAGEETAVGRIRATLGAPGLILDPAVRYDDPNLAAGLNAPMTYGELVNTVTQFIAPGVYKGIRRSRGAAPPEPALAGAPAAPAPPTAPAPAAPPAAPAAPAGPMGPPKTLADLMRERSATTYQRPAEGPAVIAPGGPRTMADVLRDVSDRIAPPEPAPAPAAAAAPAVKRPFRADEPVILERADQAIPRPAEPGLAPAMAAAAPEVPRPAAAPIPEGPLEMAAEVALRDTETAIDQAFREVLERPKPATPISGGAPVEAVTPEVSPGALDRLATMWQELDAAEPGRRFLITEEYGKVTGAIGQRSTYPQWMTAFGAKTRQQADKLKGVIDNLLDGKEAGPVGDALIKRATEDAGETPYSGEAGRVSKALLARMALGAAAGGTQGDTPEERIRNMLIGMGAGAIASRANAARIADAYKRSGLADETGAVDMGKIREAFQKKRLQPGEEAFQPNYERLDLTANVRNTMKAIHREAKDEILARKGPPKRNIETALAAETLIREDKMTVERILEMGPEQMWTPEEQTAGRMLMARSVRHAGETAERIRAGEVLPEGTLAEAHALASVVARNVRVAQARAGQVLQANKIKIDAEGTTRYRPEDVLTIRDTIGQTVSDAELAQIYGQIARTPEAQARFHGFTAVAPKLILEAMYASMLSGKALVRNAVGNLFTIPMALTHRAIMPYMPKWGAPGPGVYPGEVGVMIAGYWEETIAQTRMIRHWSEWAEQADRLGTNKLEARYLQEGVTSADFGMSGMSAWAFDFLHKAVRVPLDIMNGTDGSFKAINGRAAMRVEAYRQAHREGLSGESYTARVEQLNNSPQLLDTAALKKVVEFRQEQTFTKDFEGNVLSALQRGPENPWLQLAYRNQFLPFFRTPLRIGEMAARETPGLNMLAAEFWRDVKSKDPVKIQGAQARLATGAAIIGSFAWMESQGLITGTAPKDTKLAELWRASGIPEKSFWDPQSKKWRSYDGFEPVTTLITTGADTSAMIRNLPEQDALTLTMGAVLSQVNNFEAKQYMQAVSDLTDVIKAGASTDAQIELAFTKLRRRLAAWSPAALREIREVTDPVRRRAMASGEYDAPLVREWHALRDEYRKGIPGLSDEKDEQGNFLVPPYRDPLTGVMDVTEGVPFNIIPGKSPSNHPVYAELRRLRATPDLSLPDFMGQAKPSGELGMTAPKVTGGVRLTPPEKDRWIVLMTQVVRDPQGRTLEEALTQLIASPIYQRQSDDPQVGGKIGRIRTIWGDFKERSERALRDESPVLNAELRKREIEKKVQARPTDRQDAVRQMLQGLGR